MPRRVEAPHLFNRPLRDLLHLVGGIQDQVDLVHRQGCHIQNVLVPQAHSDLMKRLGLYFRSLDVGSAEAKRFHCRLMDDIPKPVPAHIEIDLIPRPIDHEGFSPHGAQIDESPEAAVVALVAVVPHHEEFSLGNALWARNCLAFAPVPSF